MSADIIQFVPRPNPNRDRSIFEALAEIAAVALAENTEDTAPSEYVAPSDDCA